MAAAAAVFALVLAGIAHGLVLDFYVTNGWDASNGIASQFTTSDINRLNESDDSRMATNAWSGLETFDESRYVEFIFSPNITGTVRNVNLTFEYRRNGVLNGTKLEVWDGIGWRNESIGMPNASSTDVAYWLDNLSYINASNINGAKVRFLAYRNTTGTSQTTSHDLVKIAVDHNRYPAVTLLAPAAGDSISGNRTIAWNATDDESLLVTIAYNRNGTLTGIAVNETNDGAYEIDTTPLGDGLYELRAAASDGELAAESSVNVTVDNTKPVISYVLMSPEVPRRGRNFTFIVAPVDAAVAGVNVSFGNQTLALAGAGHAWTAAVVAADDGNFSATIRVADRAGNLAQSIHNFTVSPNGTDLHYYNTTTIGQSSRMVANISGNTSVALNFSLHAAVNGTVSIAAYRSAPSVASVGKQWLPAFIAINVSDAVRRNLSSAILTIHYTDADVAGLDEASLVLYAYNETSLAWQPAPSTVNAGGNAISANVSHLSWWGIFGVPAGTTTTASTPAAMISTATTTTALQHANATQPCTNSSKLSVPASLKAHENSTVTIAVIVSNTGTCEWSARMNMSLPAGWGYEKPGTARVPGGKAHTWQVAVRVPANAGGVSTIYVGVAAGNRTETGQVRVEVLTAGNQNEPATTTTEVIARKEPDKQEQAPVTGLSVSGKEAAVVAAVVLAALLLVRRIRERDFRERFQRQLTESRE
ncbi:MAG: hypothetical protein HYY37_06890 [Candidatus Aenigmarchaeota archaeon]|nr:hypothetical protein [Candidatus Aenigmarchaeota archaeon]